MTPTDVMKDCLVRIKELRRKLEDERDVLIAEEKRLDKEQDDNEDARNEWDPESDEEEPDVVDHQAEIDACAKAHEKLDDLDAQLEEVEDMLK